MENRKRHIFCDCGADFAIFSADLTQINIHFFSAYVVIALSWLIYKSIESKALAKDTRIENAAKTNLENEIQTIRERNRELNLKVAGRSAKIQQLIKVQQMMGLVCWEDLHSLDRILRFKGNIQASLKSVFDPDQAINNAISYINETLNALSEGQEYRVCLMEPAPSKKSLGITSYSFWPSRPGEPPTMVNNGKTLAPGVGVAGRAWEQRKSIYVSDTGAKNSIYLRTTAANKCRTQSMVSHYLKYSAGNKEGEEFIGILNVSTDKKNHFTKPKKFEHEDVELIEPFIRQSIFYIKLRQLVEEIENRSVSKK